MPVSAKICGLNDPASVAAVAGARFMGLVFYRRSPRYVTPRQAAALAQAAPPGVARVGVFVDPDDAALRAVLDEVRLDFVQLHGAESAARVRAVRRLTGAKIIKAIKLERAADFGAAEPYEDAADWLLFDAKAPPDALPGGNARAFDWRLLAAQRPRLPWLLSGGLHIDNVAQAVMISGARAVDVSSGVESEPGRKDPAKIRAFLETVARLPGAHPSPDFELEQR